MNLVSGEAALPARPNILWIVTTQWRGMALGCMGDPNACTPHLDGRAARGVNFTQAVTPHPFGPFARAALLTGVSSPANGVSNYFDMLPTGARTVAHELRERGYATAFFGKWGVGRRDPGAPLIGEAAAKVVVPPEARGGFEFWEGFEGGFRLNDPWMHGTCIEGIRRFFGYQSDVVGEHAAGWIRRQNPNAQTSGPGNSPPWFCVASLEAPHPPYDAPAAGVTARPGAELILRANVPQGGETEERARRELAGYYAHLEATDRAVGRLADAVEAAEEGEGRASRIKTPRGRRGSVVVFTSVHGDMHGAHGLFRKGWPQEESVRVPLLVWRTPQRRSEEPGDGSTDETAVSLADLPVMTLAWADGADGPKPAVGVQRGGGSQLAAKNSFARISMPGVVALPHQCDRVWRGVRTPTRKVVLNPDGSPWLFFDLKNDPLEQRNLVGVPAQAVEMAELMRLV